MRHWTKEDWLTCALVLLSVFFILYMSGALDDPIQQTYPRSYDQILPPR